MTLGIVVFLYFLNTVNTYLKVWQDLFENSTHSEAAAAPVVGSLSQTVYDRGLVTRKVDPQSIVKEHAGFHFNVSRRLSPGRALGFVSPWAARSDETVWRFGSKLYVTAGRTVRDLGDA